MLRATGGANFLDQPSMKVPPKRKGNAAAEVLSMIPRHPLNESPSEKEGKCWSVFPKRPKASPQ